MGLLIHPVVSIPEIPKWLEPFPNRMLNNTMSIYSSQDGEITSDINVEIMSVKIMSLHYKPFLTAPN